MSKAIEYYEVAAKRLWTAGKYEEALHLLRQGLAMHPQSDRLKLGIAMTQLRMGNYVIAREALLSLMPQAPESTDILAGLVEVYLNLGRRMEAVDYALKTYNSNPRSAVTMEHMGMLFLEHGMFSQAAFYFEKAVTPKDRPVSRFGLAISYSGLSRPQDSVVQLKRAIRLRKHYFDAMSYLANLLYDTGNREEAFKIFSSIPDRGFNDPIAIARFLDFCVSTKAFPKRVPVLKARLQAIMSSVDIFNYIKQLEVSADAQHLRDTAVKIGRLGFPSVNRLIKFSEGQIAWLYEMKGCLRKMFGRLSLATEFSALPKVKRFSEKDSGEFFSVLASYLRPAAEGAGELPLSDWSSSYGLESLSPYACALLLHASHKDRQAATQSAVDAIFENLVSVVKQMPPGLKGSRWVVELTAFLAAFWKGSDMLERLFIMREVMSQGEKVSVEPLVERARAWRRWLGYSQHARWQSAAEQLLKEKEVRAMAPVRCKKCGRIIADAAELSDVPDKKGLHCPECTGLVRCPHCGGPARQKTEKTKLSSRTVNVCMQCGKTFPVKAPSARAKKRK